MGSFNAGIVGFFYKEGRVINLDGVVNNAAAEALRARNLGCYAEQAGIVCLADVEQRPQALWQSPLWGDCRPTEGTSLLWREQQHDPRHMYRSIYRVAWP